MMWSEPISTDFGHVLRVGEELLSSPMVYRPVVYLAVDAARAITDAGIVRLKLDQAEELRDVLDAAIRNTRV